MAKYADMDPVETIEPRPSLSSVLSGQVVGSWVVLDPDMTRVIGSAKTPQEALRNAGVAVNPSVFDRIIGERPVMLQVPDPSMMCFY